MANKEGFQGVLSLACHRFSIHCKSFHESTLAK